MAMIDNRIAPALLGLHLLLLAGCPDKSGAPASVPQAPAKPAQPLTLMVVEDAELGQAIARQWRSRTEEDINVRDVSADDVAKANRLACDVVIFPAGLIGQLADRGLIAPFEHSALESAEFDYRDIFDQLRLREMKWGSRTLAVTLGSPQLLLAYRADIFEQLGHSPPADWAEYQSLLPRLADRSLLANLAVGERWRATIEPLADGYAGQLLLARAAAYALHREQVSPLFRFGGLEALIDQPPFVKALEDLVAAAKSGDFAAERLAPQQAFAELQAGRCAMAISWPAPDVAASAKQDPEQPAKIAFALLPGSPRAYRFATRSWDERVGDDSPQVPLVSVAGRMAGVSTSAADPRRAQGFAVWLAGREVSEQIAPHSSATTLFRHSQVPGAKRWTGALSPAASRQYAETLAQSLSLPRAFPNVTLPGRLEYLQALDRAVQQAVEAKVPPREALKEAAAAWNEITAKLGLEAQQRANARSLGQAD
jgi:multiple sugar transport system substrate-binding protein